jgi:DNA polymerase-3 subunit gamma/tau
VSKTATGYVVLARKWRPMTFSDLVGQDHVAQTLGNAIAKGRVAHAFLFTGVRGVGKTTSARILAKALNCLNSDGPTATPCLECSACKEITDGSDVDVLEIDGASYNGVDEVRKLQESLPFRPSRDRYKIVIVDEVHMLSQSAWNAFLKTLEEPPAHVKFIFATTEVHKVPVTILSRVQRFDFKLIPARLIMDRLRFVLARENIEAEDSALSLIARQAAGSMRDAMSLLDQVIAWSNQELGGDSVARVLGVASRRMLLDLGRALIEGRAEEALGLVDAAANQGFDVVHVTRDLLALLRDAVISAVCENPKELIDLPEEEQADVHRLVSTGTDDLIRLHQAFSKGYDDVARSSTPRAALEMLLVKSCRRPPLLPIDDLIDRLSRLERRISTGSGAGGASGGGRLPTGGARPEARREGGRSAEASQTPVDARPAPDRPPGVGRTPTRGESKRAAPTAGQPTSALSPTSALPSSAGHGSGTNGTSVPPAEGIRTLRSPAPTPLQGPDSTPDSDRPVERWRQVVDKIRQRDPKLGAFLDHAEVLEVSGHCIRLGIDKHSLFRSEVTSRTTQQEIAEVAAQVFGRKPTVEFETSSIDSGSPTSETVFAKDKEARTQKERDDIERAKAHPVVLEAVRVFGARVKSIELPKSDG